MPRADPLHPTARLPLPLSRLDARWRLLSLLALVAAAAAVRSLGASSAILATSLLLASLARMPWAWFLDRLWAIALFLALFAVPLLFFGEDWLAGLTSSTVLVCKSLALFTLACVLLVAAPLETSLKAAHALRVPGLLVHIALLAYRYLFVLGDELARLRVALRTRAFRNRANLHSWRTAAAAAGTLLVRGHDRAERVAHAMRCRGFDGSFRSLAAFATSPADILFFVLSLALSAGLGGLDLWCMGWADVSESAIVVSGLSYSYPQGGVALDGVTFAVRAGESVGLVGPNGAGKTSLFLCLAGVLPPKAGSVLVCGLDVRGAAQRRRLPEKVGIVFQDSDDQLFCATVGDDVAFGPLNLNHPPDEVRRRVTEALGRVGMAGQEERVPLRLSGGGKRRVALAGVLAMHPEVLLLDEPSMFLDPRGRRGLIELLNGLGGTKVIASHDLEFVARTCGRVLVLAGGKVAADGEPRAVLSDAALMEAHGLEVPWGLR